MGMYLNAVAPYSLYKTEAAKPYFVDKSMLLYDLSLLLEESSSYICITRPRRFGKTIMANMISAFFNKDVNSKDIFDRLEIAKTEKYQKHRNKYHVISISFNEMPEECKSYRQYIARIVRRLKSDLVKAYPELDLETEEAVWDIFSNIFERDDTQRYIFVLDEWDFIFHQDFVSESEKRDYLLFLRNLLKDRPYVLLAYMTGILPIAKYSSGSELNMFTEFTMAKSPAFSSYFGFTEEEVDRIYARYISITQNPAISREGLRRWYNGYHTADGENVYNPRSVVQALRFNNLSSYWTSSGPYDEIFYYIEKNVADVRDDLAVMIAGEAVPARIEEYAAVSMNLQTKDEIFSAMVVYGFLSYEKGKVTIPNKELLDKFADMICKESSLGYLYQIARTSDRMLRATKAGDTKTVEEILEYVHNTETPIYSYNHEVELAAIVTLAYLSARDYYRMEREDKAGVGFVDFIFYPIADMNEDCIILELKVNASADDAILQIKNKNYALRFDGKLGMKPQYTGRILAVGISYDKATKKHSCKIEVLKHPSI